LGWIERLRLTLVRVDEFIEDNFASSVSITKVETARKGKTGKAKERSASSDGEEEGDTQRNPPPKSSSSAKLSARADLSGAT
jgi:hypothetical protein